VTGDHAKVRLVVDPRHSVGARLTNSGEVGVVTGRGQDEPRLELIDPTVEVAHGEEVVTSGFDKGVYPLGIPIGRIGKAQEARDGLTQSATVQPFVDFTRLDFVRVLLDTGPAKDIAD
jgi:rod shape-determining protein MreC